MNVITRAELSDDNVPVLRTAEQEAAEYTGYEEAERLIQSFDHVQLYMSGDDESEQVDGVDGSLYVTSRRIMWIRDPNAQRAGFGWDMRIISLHAISRDPSAFSLPCVYCQMDLEDCGEVRFVPSNEDQLQEVFAAFSKAAELNPDSDSEDEDEMNGNGWIYNAEEVEGNAHAAQVLAHLDSVLTVDENGGEDGQFEDAEEEK